MYPAAGGGRLGFVLNQFEALIHQTQSGIMHIWTIWKSLVLEQDRKQDFPLPNRVHTTVGNISCWNSTSALCYPSLLNRCHFNCSVKDKL